MNTRRAVGIVAAGLIVAGLLMVRKMTGNDGPVVTPTVALLLLFLGSQFLPVHKGRKPR